MNYVIDETASVGTGCQIGNFTTVGAGCVLGDRVILHDRVTIYPGVKIGDGTEIFDGAVIGRPPKVVGNVIHKIAKQFDPAEIGADCVIGANAVLYADVRLGNRVLIGDGAKLREGARIEDDTLVAMNCTFNHDVTVKRRSKVLDLTHVTANTIIEEEVFVGAGVISVNDNAMRMSGSEVGPAVQIHMESGSKIGSGAIILPGKIVGKESFVAAGSVVTKDVDPGKLVIGSPARER